MYTRIAVTTCDVRPLRSDVSLANCDEKCINTLGITVYCINTLHYTIVDTLLPNTREATLSEGHLQAARVSHISIT